MVTKQEQLEWMAKNVSQFPDGFHKVFASAYCVGVFVGFLATEKHEITREEWQQERDRQAELKAMTMQMCELKPLERDKMQKQNSSWHERGDLPPVGCECEWIDESGVEGAAGAVYPGIGDVVSICAHKQTPGGDVIAIFTWEHGGDGLSVAASRMPSDFRPLHTERKKAIDEMADIICAGGYFTSRDGAASKISERIYDAGYRKQQGGDK